MLTVFLLPPLVAIVLYTFYSPSSSVHNFQNQDFPMRRMRQIKRTPNCFHEYY